MTDYASDAQIAQADREQLALGIDHPLNGGGDTLVCAHGVDQCHARGTEGHL